MTAPRSQLTSLISELLLNRNGYCIAFSMPVPSHVISLKPVTFIKPFFVTFKPQVSLYKA